MLDQPTTFWGKLRRPGDGAAHCEWHPLLDHCADVAAVAEALLDLPVWRARLARLAGSDLDQVRCARLCVLAALHDLGKLNLGFQAKGRDDLGGAAGHVDEALGALCRGEVFPRLAELNVWGESVLGLLVASICHHGRPHSLEMAEANWQATRWTPRAGLDPKAGAEELFERSRAWFPDAFAADAAPLPATPVFSHAFAGLVMLADWIGSDTLFFPFSNNSDDRMPFARARAREAVTAMALDVAATRFDNDGRDPFSRVAPPTYAPRPAQQAVLTLPLDDRGSITILEAETGSGKTEAALARFVTLFEAGLVDGMYFALPTRSAATQMHRRVREAAARAFATPPAVIMAVPGYLRVDDVEGERKLASFEVLWADQDRFRYRAWAAESAKRYLVGCIVVGTIDQVLLSSLMVGHAHLRATALLRHLLVVDEVHASDTYMARILEDVLARHRAAGGYALLLSATLGGEARSRLLRPGQRANSPTLAEATATPYPLISHRAETESTIAVAHGARERAIGVEARPWMEDAEALARVAAEAAFRGAKVLVVRNTVDDCLATQLVLERVADSAGRRDVLFACAGLPAPHHARFARADREALDVELETRFGLKRPERGCVVVATQTVQQSLDLDADVLFTDLCPADVLLQRLGRLHRHERTRPGGFETARATVLVPTLRDLGEFLDARGVAHGRHGLASVYRDLRVLEATWRLVEKQPEWRIPAMNRDLVENSLHSSVLDSVVKEGGARWQRHAEQVFGEIYGQTRQADLNLVDWSRPYGDACFPNKADQRIATRLGEGDRLVHFGTPVTSPFGNEIREVTVRASWAVGVPTDCKDAEDVSGSQGVTRFAFGERRFVYDRLGLRPEADHDAGGVDDDGP